MHGLEHNATSLIEVSAQEAVDNTSSQIYLSRGVADSDSELAPPQNAPTPPITTFYESSSKHCMTLGPSFIDEDQRSSTGHNTGDGSASPSGIQRLPANSDLMLSEAFSEEPDALTPERGRSLQVGPKYPNPLARAESRARRNDAAIELDGQPIMKRPRFVISWFHQSFGDFRVSIANSYV